MRIVGNSHKIYLPRKMNRIQKRKKQWREAGVIRRILLFVACTVLWANTNVQMVWSEETENLAESAKAQETIAPPEEMALYARAAVLMDAESGRVLYEKNGFEHMPNASTTKIMTCILALELGDLDDKVAVSSYAASMPKVRLGMGTDDTFRLKDLLYSLMLESHNDSAVAIAEHIAGSVEKFATLMNEKAKELGCKDTYFITPNGLDGQDESGVHGTTAEDLAKIMSYCIKNEAFLKITRTSNHQFSNLAGTKSFVCNNHNAFLQMMDGALSGKTGFTGNAGYCYVGALQREGRTFVVALLACGWPNNKTYKWSDTQALMNYGLTYYQNEDVYEYDKEFAPVVAEGAEPENERLYQEVRIPLEASEKRLVVLKRSDEEIQTIYDLPQKVQAPVKKGQKLGCVRYYLDEKQIAEIPVCAGKSVKKQQPSWYRDYLLKLLFMVKNFHFEES
jgi:D-alanyl-D-alanine carboxypeptidase (penicillin-binding protein 5/6)